MPKVEDDKLARQYLLGELSEQDGAKVEEEYFEDDETFEKLSAVEDELIDAYTLGQLSSAERQRFEQRLLLSSAQRERVKFARTLLRTVPGAQQIGSNIPPLKRTASWWTPRRGRLPRTPTRGSCWATSCTRRWRRFGSWRS